MWTFALRNLKTRPVRTALGLIGLSIPIVGVLGLHSLSGGLRALVNNTMGQIQGLMVVRENVPTPVFSDVPAELAEKLRRVPGVRVVAPELWKLAPPVEGSSLIRNISRGLVSGKSGSQAAWDITIVLGEDIAEHHRLRSAVGPKAILPPEQGGGRYLNLSDRGKPHVVISKKIAQDHKDAQGRPKQVGDTLKIGGRPFTIVGMYETKSVILDVLLVMDIGTARELLGVPQGVVSSFYVEADDPAKVDDVTRRIEEVDPGIDARRVAEFQVPYGAILDQVDSLLLMAVSLAIAVGVIGIINTMLMSTAERFVEFGVLRANGWTRLDVLGLVLSEGAGLGVLAGLLGGLLTLAGVAVADQFTGAGLHLSVTPQLFAGGLALSLTTGTLGGLYPAWRASRLVPMDAIRRGAR
jgi:putative ABC transport system permease protein